MLRFRDGVVKVGNNSRVSDKTVLSVVYFGTYEPNYSRNRILIKGLRKNFVEVSECNVDIWRSRDKTDEISFLKIPVRILWLLGAYLVLTYKYISKMDYKQKLLIVGYPGHLDIYLAFVLTRLFNQKLIFDPLISVYETIIEDRKLIKNPIFSKALFLFERSVFVLNDGIIVDTAANGKYYRKLFKLNGAKRIFIVSVGADEELFPYSKMPDERPNIKVLFVGKFSPLHGLPVVLKSAKRLAKETNVKFVIVGSGQVSKQVRNLARDLELTNVEFIDWIPYHKLHTMIAGSDICLGIFGYSAKAERVVPNKIYQAMAIGRPVITRKSRAISEIFTDGENIIMSSKDSPKSLAESIIKLARRRKKRLEISQAAYGLYSNKFETSKVGDDLKHFLQVMLSL